MRGASRRSWIGEPTLVATRCMLGAVLLALALRLVLGADPWTGGLSARLRAGEALRSIDYARCYGWWAAAVNIVVVAALLASARHWLGPRDAPAVAALAPPRRAHRARFLAAVAAAIAMEAVLAWPRLSQGFWDDEMSSLKRYIDGSWRRGENGELVFVRATWSDTLWKTYGGQNHVPFSIASRSSIAASRLAAGAEPAFPSEAAARAPAYLAGLASLAATAFFLRRIGFAAAGVGAAWLLALHPWHLRYASEARGYAFLFLLIPVTWSSLVAVLERGTWRRWLLYGLAQTLLLWTHTSMLYQLAVTNLVAAASLWHLHRGMPALRSQLWRLTVTGVGSAALYAQLALPNLAQLSEYLAHGKGGPSARPRDVASHLLAGLPWKTPDAHFPSLRTLAEASPILFDVWVGATLLLAAVGLARLLAARGVRARLAPMLLLPVALAYGFARQRQDTFFVWYVVFALPGLAALVALGATSPAAGAGRHAGRALPIVALAGYLTLFAWLTAGPRSALRTIPILPEQEAVLLARPTLDPSAPANQRIETAFLSRPDYYYDPRARRVRTLAELEAAMVGADQREAPLFVSRGARRGARGEEAEVMGVLERRDLFEPVGSLYGFDRRGEFHVYRYLGGRSR